MNIPDHPDIRAAERTGYADYPKIKLCPRCGEDIGAKSYEVDGEEICRFCFIEWVEDYMSTDLDQVAGALNIQVKYIT